MGKNVMSAARIWFGRSIVRFLKRYGYTGCSACLALVFLRRYNASIPMMRIRRRIRCRPARVPSSRRRSRNIREPANGSPGCRLLRELRQSTNHRRHIPFASQWTFPSSHVGLKHIGEVAGRSLCSCGPQVDADARALTMHCTRLRSCRTTYTTALRNLMHICHQHASAFHLLSRVGEGDISAHRRELTRSCSSTFQCSA